MAWPRRDKGGWCMNTGRDWSARREALLTRAISEQAALAFHLRTLVPRSLGHWWYLQDREANEAGGNQGSLPTWTPQSDVYRGRRTSTRKTRGRSQERPPLSRSFPSHSYQQVSVRRTRAECERVSLPGKAALCSWSVPLQTFF